MSTNVTTATNRYGALPDTAFHLERFAGFGRAILEPACGTGRTLVPLPEAGYDVTGFGQVGVVGELRPQPPIRPGAQSLTFEAVRI